MPMTRTLPRYINLQGFNIGGIKVWKDRRGLQAFKLRDGGASFILESLHCYYESYVPCEMFADAFVFFGDMKVWGHLPNRLVYTMLMKICVRGERVIEATNYLLEMIEMGLAPRSQSFYIVVEGLRHFGKHELARRMEKLELEFIGS